MMSGVSPKDVRPGDTVDYGLRTITVARIKRTTGGCEFTDAAGAVMTVPYFDTVYVQEGTRRL